MTINKFTFTLGGRQCEDIWILRKAMLPITGGKIVMGILTMPLDHYCEKEIGNGFTWYSNPRRSSGR